MNALGLFLRGFVVGSLLALAFVALPADAQQIRRFELGTLYAEPVVVVCSTAAAAKAVMDAIPNAAQTYNTSTAAGRCGVLRNVAATYRKQIAKREFGGSQFAVYEFSIDTLFLYALLVDELHAETGT